MGTHVKVAPEGRATSWESKGAEMTRQPGLIAASASGT
jgi:hypothetical protein